MKDPVCHSRERPANTPDYRGGTPAPESGTYEQLNVFARPTGHRVAVRKGEPLPPLPRGFSWRRVDGG
jgi:hypothetical protein